MLHIIAKVIDTLFLGVVSLMFFLIYFRVIPIKKDKDNNELAHKKLGKIFLICGIIILLSAIFRLFFQGA